MAKTDLNTKLFGKVTFSTLLEDIYNNSRKKEKQIRSLIDHLNASINTPQEATLVVPLLKEYLDIGVKNDELLIKMAGIVQRAISTNSPDVEDGGLSMSEKEELFKMAKESQKELNGGVKNEGV